MATTEISLAQELIEMILRSQTISEEQQKSYIERIVNGDFTVEMQEELATIFENEMRRLDGEMETMGKAISSAETEYAEEWKQIEPHMQKVAGEEAAETAQAVADFNAECEQAEKTAESTVEGATRESEQAEADAIRESLKQNPSEGE